MKIRKIKVTNFKSFKDIEVELQDFNILIGSNASGKSNFVSIFKFLKDIASLGLENAVSIQGGVEYLRNMKIASSQDMVIKIGIFSEKEISFHMDSVEFKTNELEYELKLSFYKKRPGFKVKEEGFKQECKFFSLKNRRRGPKKNELIGEGEIKVIRKNGKLSYFFNIPKEVPLRKEDIFPPFWIEKELTGYNLLLDSLFLYIVPIKDFLEEISIYDFDPKFPKKASPITGKAELEEDGGNLSIILKNIIENKEKRRKLLNFVKDLLPFVENLNVEKFADKSLLFKLKESYFKNQYLPATLISDGTINITALIIALYFEGKPLAIIEEPERNIHPYLMSKVVDMMKDSSKQKQIIVTTHNPEIVRFAALDSLLLVSRDEEGFSKISRPSEKEEVRSFLKNEIGIEELYVQNLL